MKRTSSIKIIVFAMALSLLLTGCAIPNIGGSKLPETTGSELGVYLFEGRLVDSDGNEVEGYALDENGNVTQVVDGKSRIVVAAENLTNFTCIMDISIEEKDEVQEIPYFELSDGGQIYGSGEYTIIITAGPEHAVNTYYTIESSDGNTLRLADAGEEKIIEVNGAGEYELKLEGLYPGSVKLIIRNCLGEICGTVDITIKAVENTDPDELAEIEAKVAGCDHDFEDLVVAATETAEGYTQHTCSKCGYTYRDEFTEKLPCQHEFTDRVVEPTCTEEGYTLHTCSKCGYSERTDETPMVPHNFRDEVVASTCSEQGYTKHTCIVCGHEETDTYTEKKAHTYTDETVAATCSSRGYTQHTCTVCGHVEQDNYTETLPHTYTDTVTSPTYRERGYTTHTCTVCGYSYVDSYVDKLVCTSHQYTETERRDATCAAAGYVKKTCSLCGNTVTEEIPALAHTFADTVTEATCTTGGHTTHTCTACGYSYTDNEVGPLGHDWTYGEYQSAVRSESHTICNGCGLDMTAAGVNVSEHAANHALNGENGSYRTISVVVEWETCYYRECTRCGKLEDVH